MKENDVQHLEYHYSPLRDEDLKGDPFDQFASWYQEASAVHFADACVLSTVDESLFPDSRVVLCRSFSKEGFVFFTDYSSSKGKQISMNNQVSLLFYWKEQQRQVRILGRAYQLSSEVNQRYFSSRPLESQVTALLNRQSRILKGSRSFLEERFQELSSQFKSSSPPCPSYWGGYSVRACRFEFWQGLPHRLHDRFLYLKEGVSCWSCCRLSP